MHNHAPGQLPSVQGAGLWREHVSDDDLDAHGHEIASQAAGVRNAKPLLFPTFLSHPRRGSARDDQLAHIIHIDEGASPTTVRKGTRRHTLAHRRPSRENQRWPTHNSADPGHVEDPDLLAIVVNMEGQQAEVTE
jgi:hypothetical protein